MKVLERLIYFLFPHLLLKSRGLEDIWNRQEKQVFLFNSRIFFGLAAVVYILHYYTVDRGEGLAPSELWFRYRYGMAAIALVCLGFYSWEKLYRIRFYKVPMILACATYCYFQTETIIWYSKVPYLYSFAFILISCLLLGTSVLNSLLYCIGLEVLVWSPLMESGQSPSMMFSASVVTALFTTYMKAKYLADIRLFVANQENIESQRKIIEINLEFTNQVKAFLPLEISNRLSYFVRDQRMSVVQAIDEVLRPKTTFIASIFSDIRGFTRGSNDLSGFVSQSLLPNLKSTTQAVELFGGIPRKIGDLLFAYFDGPSSEEIITNALRSAIEISNISRELNQSVPDQLKINRYILVSCGQAVVGNLSSYDSGIEITAIGKPVNLLSRIDELTKNEILRKSLVEGDILLTSEMAEETKKIFSNITLNLISLSALGLKVRDFEQVAEIYLLPVSKKNYQIIFKEFRTPSENGAVA